LVQNPSLVLSLFMVIFAKIGRFKVVVDAHNEGLMPFHAKNNWLLPIYAMVQRSAALTIVTNSRLAQIVSGNGGTPFVLEDKIPDFRHCSRVKLQRDSNVVYVCTFEKDEPYREIIQAARMIDSSIRLYVTGRFEKAPPDLIAQAPPNARFTGFIPDHTYIDLLYSCDVIIDLTLMQDCLVCGAYEAVALGKPVILSDTEALRGYFSKGAVYTESSPEAIAEAIAYALANKEKLSRESDLLRAELQVSWDRKFAALNDLLDELN